MSATSQGAATNNAARTKVQQASLAVGVIFLLVGVLGFIPGATTNYDEMMFASHMSGALLLGLFQVSILHNIVHLLFGIAGVALARSVPGARNYLIWGGVIYLVFWIYGLLTDHESMANIIPFNNADNWLHLVLGVGMVALGYFLSRQHRTGRNAATP